MPVTNIVATAEFPVAMRKKSSAATVIVVSGSRPRSSPDTHEPSSITVWNRSKPPSPSPPENRQFTTTDEYLAFSGRK